jgi:type IV pilus assembly protein PilA
MQSGRIHGRASKLGAAGFTLVELMMVVIIVGVLAMLAVVGFRRLVSEAHTTEATQMVNSIRVAQEAYHAETGAYADLTPNSSACVTGISCSYFYPQVPDGASTGVGDFKATWGSPCGAACNAGVDWIQLAIHPSGPVMFGYTTMAGFASSATLASSLGGNTPPTTIGETGGGLTPLTISWPTSSATDWYFISATGDEDRDGYPTVVAASTFSNDLIMWGEGI